VVGNAHHIKNVPGRKTDVAGRADEARAHPQQLHPAESRSARSVARSAQARRERDVRAEPADPGARDRNHQAGQRGERWVGGIGSSDARCAARHSAAPALQRLLTPRRGRSAPGPRPAGAERPRAEVTRTAAATPGRARASSDGVRSRGLRGSVADGRSPAAEAIGAEALLPAETTSGERPGGRPRGRARSAPRRRGAEAEADAEADADRRGRAEAEAEADRRGGGRRRRC
jgi:hypothetical protein